MAYTWDENSGRFRDPAGRFVSERAVRHVVDQVADASSARMAAASEALLRNEMSLATWQATVARELKTAHTATAVIAHGGAEQMTFSRWGAVGPVVKDQYGYLRSFAEDIASGRQPLNRTIVSRSEMYGQASRITYERTRSAGQQARGYRLERNILHANESCAVCRSESGRGWVPIGSLIPIGSRTCLSRCRCSLDYSRSLELEGAA